MDILFYNKNLKISTAVEDAMKVELKIADAPPTPLFYLHLPDGSWRSGSWSMPTTNYSYTLSYSLNVL